MWGVESELFQMNWADEEPWDAKFARLLARVDVLRAEGKAVGLVGVSAGASAAINVYAARTNDIAGIVLIAAKVNRPTTIGALYREENPAFVSLVEQCVASLGKLDAAARQRILSRYGWYDGRVAKQDSFIERAHNRRVPGVGHALIIALQVLFGAPSFVRFLKRLAV